jgi:cytochrome o ubiquinol oxidase operon protein cyoD
MHEELSLHEIKNHWHGTLKAYVIGFCACLVLTGVSFLLVTRQLLPPHTLMYIISGLAMVQAAVQAIFFLHVGQEAKPRWETVVFAFMLLVLLIIAVGSLWIMHDLNVRVMPDS